MRTDHLATSSLFPLRLPQRHLPVEEAAGEAVDAIAGLVEVAAHINQVDRNQAMKRPLQIV